jgi:hypothetical protein
VEIWYILPVLVFCAKKNLATLPTTAQALMLKTGIRVLQGSIFCGLFPRNALWKNQQKFLLKFTPKK